MTLKEGIQTFPKEIEKENSTPMVMTMVLNSFGNFTPSFLLDKNCFHAFYNQNVLIYVRHLDMETEMPVPWYLMGPWNFSCCHTNIQKNLWNYSSATAVGLWSQTNENSDDYILGVRYHDSC